MGLMVAVTTIAVSGAFGMSRASSYLAAENVLFRSLQGTRQIACTSGKRVIMAFVGPDGGDYKSNSFVLIESAGIVTEEIVGNYIEDRTATYSKYTSDGRQTTGIDSRTVWNLRTGGKFKGATISPSTPEAKSIPGFSGGKAAKYKYTVTQIKPKSGFTAAEWGQGHPYGFQLADIQYMPANFQIGIGSATPVQEGQLIVFEPDGTVYLAKAASAGIVKEATTFDLYIYETGKPLIASKISVKDGVITVAKRSKEG